MSQGWLQIAIFFGLLVAAMPLLGGDMARVFTGERVLMAPVAGPLERVTLRLLRVDTAQGQDWKAYARSVIFFSIASWLLLFLILRTQTLHPLNPQDFHSGTWDLSFNTASSFVTNTNWQFYGGETTLSYFSQMAGVAVQNFVSAAVGMAVAVAVIRGIAGRRGGDMRTGAPEDARQLLGRMSRAIFYVLLPLSIIGALILVSQGVMQSLGGYLDLQNLTGGTSQLATGPVASQEIIKELGTNGGGFFNVNSSMPFENPNGISNLVEMFAMLLIPVSLTYTYGRMVGSRRQGYAIFTAMSVLFVAGVIVVYLAEQHGAPPARRGHQHAGHRRLDRRQPRGQGAAFRDRQLRLWSAVTTVTSCGAVNAALSHSPASAAWCRSRTSRCRDDLRRRGHWPVFDAAVRSAGRVRRRPDGRAHAGVPRQEDRAARGQAADDRLSVHAAAGPLRRGSGQRHQVRGSIGKRLWSAGLLRDPLRLRVPGQQQRVRVRRVHRLPSAGPATSAPTASRSQTCSGAW